MDIIRQSIVTIVVVLVLFGGLLVGVYYFGLNVVEPEPVDAQTQETEARETPEGDGGAAPEVDLEPQMAPGMMQALGSDYWYLPYAVATEEQLLAFVDAYRAALAQGARPQGPLTVAEGKGVCDGNKIYRLQAGVTDRFICDINNPAASAVSQSQIPVIIAHPGPNAKAANVLFMDGHVDMVAMGEFPVTEDILAALRDLDPPRSESAQ